jgi:ComEC/Rec2-related protein
MLRRAPLLPIALGLCCGVAAGPPETVGPSIAAAAVLVGVAAVLPARLGVAVLGGAAALLGSARASPPPPPTDETLWYALRLEETPRPGAAWTRATVLSRYRSGNPPVRLPAPAFATRVRTERWRAEFAADDRVLVEARTVETTSHPLLLPTAGSEPASIEPTTDRRGGRALRTIVRRMRDAIDPVVAPTLRPMLLALVLGEQHRVPPALRDAFARTGTSHLLAISGLHVGTAAAVALAGAKFGLRRLTSSWVGSRWEAIPLGGWPDRLAGAVAVLAAAGYVEVAGAPESARRSLAMLAALFAARALALPMSGWQALSAAAIAVVWSDPGAVRSLGFQLSIASVAGLIVAERIAPRWERPLPRAAALVVLGTAMTTLATAPLCALAWGVVPVASLWANPVAIPLLEGLTIPLLLPGCLLGALHPALGAPLVELAAGATGLGLAVVEWFAEPSRAPLLRLTPSAGEVAALYAAGLLAVIAGGERSP